MVKINHCGMDKSIPYRVGCVLDLFRYKLDHGIYLETVRLNWVYTILHRS